jgi:hypothetical protein
LCGQVFLPIVRYGFVFQAQLKAIRAGFEKAGIIAVLKVFKAAENREFITVRYPRVGAEERAVSAFVAHPVYVDDLMGSLDRFRGFMVKLNHDVSPVGTYVGADLAEGVAAKAAVTVGLVGLGFGDDPLLEVKVRKLIR